MSQPKQVTVEKVQFQADDGNLFDTELEASHQNKNLAYINAPIEPDIEKLRKKWGETTLYPTSEDPIVIHQFMELGSDYRIDDNPERLKIISENGWLRAAMVILTNGSIYYMGRRDIRIRDHIIKTNDEMAAFGFIYKYVAEDYLDDGMTVYG